MKTFALFRPVTALQVMIAVDEALRRLEVSAPERNAILEAFRYADARNAAAMTTAVAAAHQEAADAAVAADGHQQAAQPMLTSKPLTRWGHNLHPPMRLPYIFCHGVLPIDVGQSIAGSCLLARQSLIAALSEFVRLASPDSTVSILVCHPCLSWNS